VEGREPSADGLGPDRTTPRYSHRMPARMPGHNDLERRGPVWRRPSSFVCAGRTRVPAASHRLRRRAAGTLSTTGPGEGVERRMRGVRRSTSAATERTGRHVTTRCATSSELARTGYRRRSVNVLWIRLWKDSRPPGHQTSRACLPSQAVGPLTMARGGWAMAADRRALSCDTGRADPARSGSGLWVARAERRWVTENNRNVMMVASCLGAACGPTGEVTGGEARAR
jgi:hypothetical protein